MSKTNPFHVAFLTLLALLTEISFTNLLADTFSIDFNENLFIIIAAIITIGFTLLHLMRKKLASAAGLLLVIVATSVMVYIDFFEIRTGIFKIYSYFRYLFTGALPYVAFVDHDASSLAILFAMVGAIPSFATTLAYMKHKTSVPAILLYFVYFLPIALDNIKYCSTIWYILCGFGILMLVIFEGVRIASGKSAAMAMIKLSLPCLLVCISLGILFPMNGYSKDKMALKQYNKIIVKIDKTLGTDFKRKIAKLRGESDSFEQITDTLASKLETATAVTDLQTEGNKSPLEYSVYNLTLIVDDGASIEDFDDIYLRNCAMSTFDGSSWVRNDNVPYFTTPGLMDSSADSYTAKGSLTIELNYLTSNRNVLPVPNNQASYYTHISTHSIEPISGIKYLYPESFTADEIFSLAEENPEVSFSLNSKYSEPQPLPEWSSSYLTYVDEECTFVPDTTKESILSKNVLPDWYMKVLNGELVMSDADKVASVMNYVYSAKRYDLKTDFVPDGEDFVAWFLADSPSGYCVHFASSTAVLLRMLGVPTRYVSGYYVGSTRDFSLGLDNYVESTYDFYNIYSKTVYESDAHAWCEYFDPDYGWIGLDPTNNEYISGYRPYTIGKVTTDAIIKAESATPKPTKEPTHEEETATPTPVQQPDTKHSEFQFPTFLRDLIENKPLTISITVILLLLLARLIYTLIWILKFNHGTNNNRIRAYCRYAFFIVGSKKNLPAKMHHLTNIAMYSQDGASKEAVNSMCDLTHKYVKTSIAKKPLPLRLLVMVFLLVTK